MPIPSSEKKLNASKRHTDKLVSDLLGLDRKLIREMAKEVAIKIKKPYRIVVCGAAGSSKTTFSEELGNHLEIPSFDFDEYIPGGWTSNEKEYASRLTKGFEQLQPDLSKAWIVEHVEACSRTFLEELRPKWAIHLNPGKDQLKVVARLRDAVSEESGERERRSMVTFKRSMTQFEAAPGKVTAEGTGWILKEFV